MSVQETFPKLTLLEFENQLSLLEFSGSCIQRYTYILQVNDLAKRLHNVSIQTPRYFATRACQKHTVIYTYFSLRFD